MGKIAISGADPYTVDTIVPGKEGVSWFLFINRSWGRANIRGGPEWPGIPAILPAVPLTPRSVHLLQQEKE